MKKRFLTLLLSAVMLLTMAAPALAAGTAKASTLRLELAQGTVSVANSDGTAQALSKGMRLYSGYRITTDESSYAYISLDDTKAIKLDQLTTVTVKQSGKKLQIQLKNGEIFFDVTTPLESDETLEIRTSTMVTGIRGCTGYVSEDPILGICRVCFFSGRGTVTCLNVGSKTGSLVIPVKDQTEVIYSRITGKAVINSLLNIRHRTATVTGTGRGMAAITLAGNTAATVPISAGETVVMNRNPETDLFRDITPAGEGSESSETLFTKKGFTLADVSSFALQTILENERAADEIRDAGAVDTEDIEELQESKKAAEDERISQKKELLAEVAEKADAEKAAGGTEIVPAFNQSDPVPVMPSSYTVTLTAGTGYTLTPDPASQSPVAPGGDYSFTLQVLTGYDGPQTAPVVKSNGTVINDVGGVYTITGIMADQTVTVEGVSINKYTVTIPTDAGYTAVPGTTEVDWNSDFTFSVTANPGYTNSVLTVSVDGNPLAADGNGFYMIPAVQADKTVVIAGVQLNTYAVTLPDAPVGYTIAPYNGSSSPVDHGGSYSFTVQLNEGYTNSTPTVQSNGNTLTLTDGVYTISNITAPQTITVDNVVLNTYTVSLPTGTGYTAQAATGSASPVNWNGTYSFTVTLDEGYSASTPTVTVNGSLTPLNPDAVNGLTRTYTIAGIQEDQSIAVAGVGINTYTVTLPTGTGYTAQAATGSASPVNWNGTYSFTVTLAEGYTESSPVVQANGSTLTPVGGVYTISGINANQTVTVENVTLNTYTITPPAESEAYTFTPPASGNTVEHGGSYAFTVAPKTGYENIQVTVNGTALNSDPTDPTFFQITNVTADQTIAVTATPITYTIEYNTDGGTINSGEVASYTYGTGATLPTDVTKTGSTFNGWYDVANDPLMEYAITTIEADQTGNLKFQAGWTIKTYVVNLPENPEHYTITPAEDSSSPVDYGGSYAFKVSAATGYYLSSVQANGVELTFDDNEIYRITNITADQTIAVDATPQEYSIDYQLQGGHWDIEDYPTTYTYGVGTALPAEASVSRTGYEFKGWSTLAEGPKDTDAIGTDVTGDKTFYAIWEEQTYTVTLQAVGTGITLLDTGNNEILTPQSVKYPNAFTFYAQSDSPNVLAYYYTGADDTSKTLLTNFSYNNNRFTYAITEIVSDITVVVTSEDIAEAPEYKDVQLFGLAPDYADGSGFNVSVTGDDYTYSGTATEKTVDYSVLTSDNPVLTISVPDGSPYQIDSIFAGNLIVDAPDDTGNWVVPLSSESDMDVYITSTFVYSTDDQALLMSLLVENDVDDLGLEECISIEIPAGTQFTIQDDSEEPVYSLEIAFNFTNYGTMDIKMDTTIISDSVNNGTITIFEGNDETKLKLNLNSNYTNNGTILNTGDLSVHSTLTNNGMIENDGTLSVNGVLINESTITNTVTGSVHAVYYVGDPVVGDGDFDIEYVYTEMPEDEISHSVIDNRGTILNNGYIYPEA